MVKLTDPNKWNIFVDEYIQDKKHKRQINKPSTERLYRSILTSKKPADRHAGSPGLYLYLIENQIDKPSKGDLENWISIIRYKYFLHISTVNLKIACIKGFFSFLRDSGIYIHKSCPESIKQIGGRKGRNASNRIYLKLEWFSAILNNIDEESIKGKRDKAILLALFYCGIRRLELVNIKKSDFTYKNNHYFFRILSKGRNEPEEILVPRVVANAIQDYLSELMEYPSYKDKSEYLFVSFSNRGQGKRLQPDPLSKLVKRYMKQIMEQGTISADEYKNLCCHSLRHSFACEQFMAGVNFFTIQKRMRLSHSQTLEIYLSSIDKKYYWDGIEATIANITKKMQGEKPGT